MDVMDVKRMTIEDKLYTVKYKIHENNPHIKIDTEICNTKCKRRQCTWVCPAHNYVWDGEMVFSYENCLECGSCMYACDMDAIQWNYPKGGMGIRLSYG